MDSYETCASGLIDYGLIDISEAAMTLYVEMEMVSCKIWIIREYFKKAEMERVPWKTSASWKILREERYENLHLSFDMMDVLISFLKEEYPKWASSFIDKDVLEGRKRPRNDIEELAVSVLEYLKHIDKKLNEIWNRLSPQAFEKVLDNNEYLKALWDIYALSKDAARDAFWLFSAVKVLALIEPPRDIPVFLYEKEKTSRFQP